MITHQNTERDNQNRYAARRAAIKLRCMMCCTDQDIDDIMKRLIADARAGDKAAAKLFLEYAAGRPDQNMNLNTPESNDPARDIQTMRQLLGIPHKN